MRAKLLRRGVFHLCIAVVLLTVAGFTAGAQSNAGTVRGRLERRDAYGKNYVAARVGVTLYNKQMGRSALTYTGTDGMYFLYNVPPGSYTLEIWTYPNQAPLRYVIQVGDVPVFDVAPILIP